MNEAAAGPGDPQDTRGIWAAAQAADNVDLDAPPWRFDQRRRHVRTAEQVAGFAEMLCQIDDRMDEALPACWMRHGFLFALIDALRSEYVYAYMEAPKSNPKGPRHSYMQTRFWLDESSVMETIKSYASSKSLGNPDIDKHEPGKYSQETAKRRESEKELGIDAVECFPWDKNDLAGTALAADSGRRGKAPSPEKDEGAWDQQDLGFEALAGQETPGESMPGFEGDSGPDEADGYDSPWLAGDDSFSQDSA